ncbi:sugar ABC transporter permease [Tessaracoccus rhinocerotis]|uniref:Sugar ABC transporter permease n=1 Tax=Tessaracoccus rhinocerotis TaxID=1689449 RepID=A0A553K5H7_9ACTN|nr:sugar ABC transporter permease [Tessaracoccus rhinocerotis]TRY19964.1 sugar ABC transporter permease [Tessaracoccus rhinocerotis]
MSASTLATTSTGGRSISERPPGQGPRKRRRNWGMALEVLLFTAPALILFAMFVVWPMLRAVELSVFRWKGFGPLVDFVGLRNYISVLTDDVFLGALGHNMFIVVASIAIQLPIGIAIALLLNRKMKFQGLVRTLVFVPYVLAEVIAGVVWFQLLTPRYGFIENVLSAIGITPPPQGFLGTPEIALWTVMVVLTWKYVGLAIILFLAGLQSIPADVDEAAQIDGASWWRIQWHITIPLLGPTLRTWAFLSMVGSLQLFDMVWILTKGGPANATTTMATFLINEGTRRSNYGIAGAASVVLFVIALVLALVYQRFVLGRDNQQDVQPRKKAGR